MEPLTAREIIEATAGRLLEGCGVERFIHSISTDSRTIKSGELFIPVVGEKHDGHNFIKDALDKGAAGALLAEDREVPSDYPDRVFVKVADTTKALGNIAAAYRRRFNITVVGVTGSNGKTTTKEMIASVLSTRFKVHKSLGNLNTEVGLPLSVLELDSSHQASVVEMGMNRSGDIAWLSRIAKPTIGVITNIGEAHIGYLGSRRNIALAKWELADSLPSEGVLILNADDPYLWALREKARCRVITYGVKNPKADIRSAPPDEEGGGIRFALADRSLQALIPIAGCYNIYNALSAVAVGRFLGLGPDSMKRGLENFRPVAKRMEVSEVRGILIVNDSYNANPTSVKESLHWLASSRRSRKIALLGDMLELGRLSARYHRQIGKAAAAVGLHILVAVGKYADYVKKGAVEGGIGDDRVHTFAHKSHLAGWLAGMLKEGDVLLVKGSRGMEMESVVWELTKEMKGK
jgi:UDP-N-acetylmuramoyl-tripeptide--D-alanyl-D-alanine ligase